MTAVPVMNSLPISYDFFKRNNVKRYSLVLKVPILKFSKGAVTLRGGFSSSQFESVE